MSTQAEPNPGWEDRYKEIAEYIADEGMVFNPDSLLIELEGASLITRDEFVRSSWKIRLIRPFLTRMVLNMIKGSIKYPTDDWSTKIWQSMGMDDKVDSVNYDLLFEDHLRRLGVL